MWHFLAPLSLATIDKVFELDGGNWNIVFNLAAATKYSQANEVYQEHIIDVARVTAAAAKKAGVQRFVQVSTGQVYDAGKKPSDEEAKIKPWTALAKASLKAEEIVAASGLAYNIVRPSIVYGPGDQSGITPRLIMGAVYQKLNETMELLWDKGLRLNTVHVRDVVKALFLIATKGADKETFNLADSSDTDQGTINKFIATLFGIKTDFMGSLKSSLATSLAMKTVADVANDKHLKPWSDLLKEQGIVDSPLTPYLDEEVLYNNSTALDGQKIVKNLGFVYDYPQINIDLLYEVVDDFQKKKYFPNGLLKYTPA